MRASNTPFEPVLAEDGAWTLQTGFGCCCAACVSGGGIDPSDELTSSVEHILPSDIYAIHGPATGKVSLDYDAAAAQITRNDLRWHDESGATGQVVGGFFDSDALGSAGTVTYGYLATADIGDSGQTPTSDYRQFTSSEIVNVELAISYWEEVANIDFIRVTGTDGVYLDNYGDAEMSIFALLGSNGGFANYAFFPGELVEADVVIGESNLETVGSYAFLTAMHELGHGIGLHHPSPYDGEGAFDYATEADYFEDSVQYTTMSYWDADQTGASYSPYQYTSPDGLMLHDIAAVQRLYGMNTTTRSGNTTYGFNYTGVGHEALEVDSSSDQIVAAIWDAGGIDTLDFSGYSQNAEIDLREEAFSSVGGLTYNLAIARGVKVENAIGGSGDDLIIQNSADAAHYDASQLDINGDPLGGELPGYDGSNLLVGGAGTDTLSYANGSEGVDLDIVAGGGTFDLGTNGVDTLSGFEHFIGTDFGDWMSGDAAVYVFDFGSGEDTLYFDDGTGGDFDGGPDGDTIDLSGFGLAVTFDLGATSFGWIDGVSVYAFDYANFENLVGTAFDDSLTGTLDGNIVDGGMGNDTIIGVDGDNVLLGGDGDDLITGGDGSDVLYGDGIVV